MKYLIVDDNENFRKLLRDEISKNGDVVLELDDGLNVNAFYKELKPDWVLMDIQMKIVDGLKATEILKREFPNAHIAVVSDYSDERFRDEAKKAGAEAFISKENLVELKNILVT